MRRRPRAPPARWLTARPHAVAALLLALPVLVLLWPALLGGDVLSPGALLYFSPPWNGHVPNDVTGYLNQLLSDVPTSLYPWRWIARELLHSGQLPAWDPHALAGTPLLNNPQTGIFSPFSLPLWLLPLNDGIGLGAALKLWVAGVGTYLLARQLRLAFLPALLAGIGFAFCAFNVVWLTHETQPAVAALLPWTLLLADRVLVRGTAGSALGLALATAVALGGGHPGTQIHVLLATVLYATARTALLPGPWRSRRLPRLAAACGGLALGALAMAIMLVPEALSSHGTIGTLSRRGATGALPGERMPLTVLRTVLFPDWWGRPSGTTAVNLPANANFNEGTFYAGVVGFVLACVGVVAPGGWRRKAPFAILGALGLAVALRAPGLSALVAHLPGLKDVQNQRLHLLFELAVAILSGFGLQALLDRPAGDRRRFAVVGALGVAGVAAVAGTGAGGAQLGALPTLMLDRSASASDAGLALASAAWFWLLAGGTALALAAARRWPGRRRAIAAGIVLLAAIDMLHFAHGYQPMGPAAKVFPPRTATVSYLQAHAREGRILGVDRALPDDWSGTYGLDDVRGYDPPAPTVRYFLLWQAVNPEQTGWQPLAIPDLTTPALRLVSMLGARYVVAGHEAQISWGDPAIDALRPVLRDGATTVLRNPWAMPRALVAQRVRVAANLAQTQATLLGAGFDPRRAAIVERSERAAASLAGAPGARGAARVVRERDAQVTMRATLDRRGLVVLDDDFTDGWSVAVDGRPAHAVRVDDVLRGVVVGPGHHRIVWSYAVPGLRLGAALSAAAWLLGLAAAGLLALRARCRRRR